MGALIVLLGLVGFALAATWVSAQIAPVPGDPQQGRELAQHWCAECHAITRDQARSPNELAPTWSSVADNAATTEFRLRAFLQTPHQNMPDIALTRDQTDHLITYILGLKKKE
jgi:cytochrome c